MGDDLSRSSQSSKGLDYGVDAPGLVRFFLVAGAVAAGVFLIASVALGDGVWLKFVVKEMTAVAALYLVGMGCLMLYWSKVVKVRERERALDLIKWRGDERVLDVGCGRGLMMIGAALRLTTGRAIGIDIWAAKDQSANSPGGARDNAVKAAVAGKVEVLTADMRNLPFDDQSFDVVVSHWVVHNLEKEADRILALREMTRVLRPGGGLILCDIEHREAYLTRLRALGLSDCQMTFSPLKDAVLGALSFGSFRPTTIFARAPA